MNSHEFKRRARGGEGSKKNLFIEARHVDRRQHAFRERLLGCRLLDAFDAAAISTSCNAR
jgi:hypothetical protein